ncbi:hypothetical protein L873DRAFT_1826287 [Choiromyces venosus 120613-1]|uniref:beta-galactosidase n=1 Tax=Choiromyces venosus 120613-1 TaxID=1336337 RepID=A0A3N4K1Y8_9PEZI|nr:hypothetical protein L873DRAFT_1826287 [Choiromyces venosus 120613-1]
MRLSGLLTHLALWSSIFSSGSLAQKNNGTLPPLLPSCSLLLFLPILTNFLGRTNVVEWDRSSLYINHERVYIFSGESHYPCLPKLRASGFNAVSIYFFWAYHSPNPDMLDFKTAALDIQHLFDYAKQAGIWVITKSGPYINAETSGRGVALWTTTGAWGIPRTSDEKDGIDKGGPVIPNQHEKEWTGVKYMVQIGEAFKAGGVVVPSAHNEKGMRGWSWSKGYLDVGRPVDIYGLDSYPNGFNCANPGGGFNIVKTYYQWFTNYSGTQPSHIPEYQGGAFDPYGGYGYGNCAQLTGIEFTDVFYKALVTQKILLISFHITSPSITGHVAAPVVYSHYSAQLTESPMARDKMQAIKSLSLFLRVSGDLRETDILCNGTTFTNSTGIYTVHPRNPKTKAGFYWANQNTSNPRAVVKFSLRALTSAGNTAVPDIQLDGRESEIIVADYAFGKYSLLYSSAGVLTYAIFDDLPHTRVSWVQPSGQMVVHTLLIQLNRWNIWAPALTTNPNVKPNQQLLVTGPHLVRNAEISGGRAEIKGDLNSTTTVEVFAPKGVRWNGRTPNDISRNAYGSLVGTVAGADSSRIHLPGLKSLRWKYSDSIPERMPKYDDSKWTLANKNSTQNPTRPATYPVLHPDDYGFHAGYKLYRGEFNGVGATGVKLRSSGGSAFGYSVWLNGDFLELPFSGKTLNTAGNVLFIVLDYIGHDQDSVGPYGPRNPRGVSEATLRGNATFSERRLTGNAGGESPVDMVRRIYNEGGLQAERLDYDIPLVATIAAPTTTKARVQICINGYQYGKYISHVGPQTELPLPPGILNNRGENAFAVSIWAQEEGGAKLDNIELKSVAAVTSSFRFGFDGEYLRPGWESKRLEHA